MSSNRLLASTERALERVAEARRNDTLHTESWRRALNTNSPEMRDIVYHAADEKPCARRFIPNGAADKVAVVFLPAPNNYAISLAEFDAGARHLGEALQRPVVLVDPIISINTVLNADLKGILLQEGQIGVVTEGSAHLALEEWMADPEFPGNVACVATIHANHPLSIDALVPSYFVDLDSHTGLAWHGLPQTPLALSRWIPEIDTYIDSMRFWFDLHLV